MSIFELLFGNHGIMTYDDNKPKSFGGVPLTELNKLADECRGGGYVTVDEGTLIYHFDSRRKHQSNRAEYIIKNGKLHQMTIRSYPGQSYYPDKEFCKIANKKYTFI